MRRDIACEMVIEVDAARACCKEPQQCIAVVGQRDVEYRQLVAGAGVHAREQRNVAFYAGNELAVARLRET